MEPAQELEGVLDEQPPALADLDAFEGFRRGPIHQEAAAG